jgi:hypothetical protein
MDDLSTYLLKSGTGGHSVLSIYLLKSGIDGHGGTELLRTYALKSGSGQGHFGGLGFGHEQGDPFPQFIHGPLWNPSNDFAKNERLKINPIITPNKRVNPGITVCDPTAILPILYC